MGVPIMSPEEALSRNLREITALFEPVPAEKIIIRWEEEPARVTVKADVAAGGMVISRSMSEERDKGLPDSRNQMRRLSRKALLQALAAALGAEVPPWGILTGVRPVKLAHRLLDAGVEDHEAQNYFTEKYSLSPEKASLLLEVALRQRPFLEAGPGGVNRLGVYLGIPFCPTRCAYCSFPAYPLGTHGGLVEKYLEALSLEIQLTGSQLKSAGVQVATVYVGGGTPTALDTRQLDLVLQKVVRELPLAQGCEITCEAGRPDTITEEKIDVLAGVGVGRVSINPQSMQEKTLLAIGRCHTPQDVEKAVRMVKDAGFPVLNMDLIAGLPGENADDFAWTLEAVLAFKPENITIHTLAIKRASRLNREREIYSLPDKDTVKKMLALAGDRLRGAGYFPYYLYRQKKIAGQLENVGYTLQGAECLYNIQIMEERHTIIGLGAGAGTKFVRSGDDIVNLYNPKDPRDYIERVGEMLKRKKEFLGGS